MRMKNNVSRETLLKTLCIQGECLCGGRKVALYRVERCLCGKKALCTAGEVASERCFWRKKTRVGWNNGVKTLFLRSEFRW